MDGRVKGYCALAKEHVDFVITRAKPKKLWQDPEYRAREIATHTGRHPSPDKAKVSAALTRWHNRKKLMEHVAPSGNYRRLRRW